jgi:hypothetical protein
MNSNLGTSRFRRIWLFVAAAIMVLQWPAALLTAETTAAPKKDRATGSVAKVNADAKQAESKAKALGEDWVRLDYDDRGEVQGMQTAVVRYAAKPAKGSDAPPMYVDLIGAVHIGDIAYYRQLNEQFTQYDAVLYELVAPEGTVVKPGRGTSNGHPIGALQNAIKTFLELDHQLEYVDYTKPNFVHADMTPDQFAKAMSERNEGFLQLYFRLMGQAMEHQSAMEAKGESMDFDLLSALFAKDRARRLKLVLAKQLADMESLMVTLGGENGTVIITERNKTALAVLKKQIDAGKKHLGIFYGAGHLGDMDKRLRNDFKLQPVSITWVTAWNLAAKSN